MFNRKILTFLAGCLLALAGSQNLSATEKKAELVWSSLTAGSARILISNYDGREWNTPRVLVDDGAVNILPSLATDNTRRQLLVWVVVTSAGETELHYRFGKNDRWEKNRVLPSPFSINLAPVVISDAANTFWVFWAANDGGQDDIYASYRQRGKWSSPTRINDENTVPDILPDAWLDESNNLWVSWQNMDEQGNYSQIQQMVAEGKGNRGGQQPTRISRSPRGRVGTFDESMVLPPFFKTKGRATIHFPHNRHHQSQTIRGTE